MQRLLAVGLLARLVVLAATPGSVGCKGHASSTEAVATGAVVWTDAGGARLAVGARTMALPVGELKPGTTPTVARDEAGTRYSYVTADDRVRVVYPVGKGLYPAPLTDDAEHAPKAPRLEEALGALFAEVDGRRAELLADVRAALGEPGVVQLLVQGADVDAPEWDATLATLPPARAEEVKNALAATLTPGKPMVGMRRAVTMAPLAELAKQPSFAERTADADVQVQKPRAAGAMLRALAVVDAERAGKIGCELLRRPVKTDPKRGNAPVGDEVGRDILVEAAVLAVARAGTDCAAASVALGDDPCRPMFRCGPKGPLTGRETTLQDEPPCTKEQILAAAAEELSRPAKDVVVGTSGTRAPLFAVAALGPEKLPEGFARAHLRRRYAVLQPKEPACDGAPIGAPCHCDEATVRDTACRRVDGGHVQVGVCAFDVDDKGKKLTNVVASPPP